MSADDEDTDRWHKPRRVQSSDDRALASTKRARSHPHGVPVAVAADGDDADQVTKPHEIFDPQRVQRYRRRRGDSAEELAGKLRSDGPDPYDLIAALAFDLTGTKERFLEQQPGGDRIDELTKAIAELAPVRAGLKWLTRSFVATAVAIGIWLYARGGKETSIDMKIQALEKAVDKIAERLEQRHDRTETHP